MSRFAADPFSIEVQFVEVSGQAYPVITVPAGVRFPVAAKRDGPCGIKDNAVYVRSLTSNNTVSSAEAHRGDWERLTRICFDNREADIGGFVRRHLTALNPESLAALLPILATMLHRPAITERVAEELERGWTRFQAALEKRGLQFPQVGFREAVILVNGEFPAQVATRPFLRTLLVNAPQHTSWTPWVDMSDAGDIHGPKNLDGGLEALLDYLDHDSILQPNLDFWRIEPKGVFYHIRALEGDLSGNLVRKAHGPLDFSLQVARIAEIISMGLSFGRSLGADEAKTSLAFGFRWKKLVGRTLTSWADQRMMLRPTGISHQDEITTTVNVPLQTPQSAISPHVENAVRDVFALFGGTEFKSEVIETIVKETIGLN